MTEGPAAPLGVAALLLAALGTVHALTAPEPRDLGSLEVPVIAEDAGGTDPERLTAIRYGEAFELARPSAVEVDVRGALPADLDLALVAAHGAVAQLRQHVAAPTTVTVDAVAPGSWSLRGLARGPRTGTVTLRARLASRSPWLLPLALLVTLPGLVLAARRAWRRRREPAVPG